MLLSAVNERGAECPVMHIKLKRAPGLYLTGFMGSGKTTVGQMVAEKLGWDFSDLDTVVERTEGSPVPTIFALQGEEVFRKMETVALKKLVAGIERGNPTVVALGGGAILAQENFDLLATAGLTIWLDCSFDTALKRVATEGGRPLAHDPLRFRQLYEDRRIAYARADYRVDAEAGPEAVASAILGLPIWK